MPKKAEPTGFGTKLRELRETAGLSQQELADKIGFHKLSVAKIEQGVREPVWATVLALAEALSVSTEEFRKPAALTAKRHPGRPPTKDEPQRPDRRQK